MLMQMFAQKLKNQLRMLFGQMKLLSQVNIRFMFIITRNTRSVEPRTQQNSKLSSIMLVNFSSLTVNYLTATQSS